MNLKILKKTIFTLYPKKNMGKKMGKIVAMVGL